MIEEKLIPGKCYKVSNKSDDRAFWNTASLEYVKNHNGAFIKCHYGVPFLFLEKVNIKNCYGYSNDFLKCLIDGKIAYFDEWKNLKFEEIK